MAAQYSLGLMLYEVEQNISGQQELQSAAALSIGVLTGVFLALANFSCKRGHVRIAGQARGYMPAAWHSLC